MPKWYSLHILNRYHYPHFSQVKKLKFWAQSGWTVFTARGYWQLQRRGRRKFFDRTRNIFSLFLPGAGLPINIECARKLLNYSCTKLLKPGGERQSPWMCLPARKLCVIHGQGRGGSIFILFTCQWRVSRWSFSECILSHFCHPS